MAKEKSPEIVFNALTEKQIADAFKVQDRTVRNWVKDGCPDNPDRSYSLYNVHAWLMDRQKKDLLETIESSDTNLKDEKLKLEIEKLRLVVEEKKLSLISISEHQEVCQSRLRTLRDYLQKNLPANADHFVDLKNRDEAREILEELVFKILDVYVSAADVVQVANDEQS